MSTARVPHVAVSTWNIDSAHTVAEFKVKHMMITNVKGQFSGVSGTVSLDEQGCDKLQGRSHHPRGYDQYPRAGSRHPLEER